MRVMLDIRDNKAASLLDVLKSLPYVKTTVVEEDSKAQILADLKEAVEEMKLIRAGKKKARSAKELIKELGASKDWWSELSKDHQKIVLQGLEQAESGKFISSTDFWQKLKNA